MAAGDDTRETPEIAPPAPAGAQYGIVPDELESMAQAKADLAAIPKIPYARGMRLSGRELMRIAMLVATLVLLLVMQKPCAQAVSSFVTNMDLGSASGAGSAAGAVPAATVHLKAGQTDAEMKQQLDQLRGSGAGSAAP